MIKGIYSTVKGCNKTTMVVLVQKNEAKGKYKQTIRSEVCNTPWW